MDNDPKLIEAIARAISRRLRGSDVVWEEDRRTAQAALDALKAEGVMLCRWERRDPAKDKAHPTKEDIWNAFRNGYKLTGLEPPAAALVGSSEK